MKHRLQRSENWKLPPNAYYQLKLHYQRAPWSTDTRVTGASSVEAETPAENCYDVLGRWQRDHL